MNGLDEPFFIGATDQAPAPSLFQSWMQWLKTVRPFGQSPSTGAPYNRQEAEQRRITPSDAASRGTEIAGSVVSRGTQVLGQQAERIAWGVVAFLLLAFGLYALARKA